MKKQSLSSANFMIIRSYIEILKKKKKNGIS